MNLINTKALVRGATLVDYAFDEAGSWMRLDVPTSVGVVAAYLGTGRDPDNIERILTARLNARVGRQAAEVLALFSACDGSGLWEPGGSSNDICFTNDRLARLYPSVNERHRVYHM